MISYYAYAYRSAAYGGKDKERLVPNPHAVMSTSNSDLEKSNPRGVSTMVNTDEERLARMGYKQELKRDLSMFQVGEWLLIDYESDDIPETRTLACLSQLSVS